MHIEATAKARYLRSSGRKARIVADLVRGKGVDEAIALLSFIPKKAAEPIKKVVKSAAANAMSEVGTGRLKAEDLTIKTICVDNGPGYKRFRAASMGRAMPVKHRLCHITVVVCGEAREERQRRKTKTATKEAKAEE